MTSEKDDTIASLEADMALIKHRLMVLEEEVTSIKQRRGGKSQTYPFPSSPIKPPPQTLAQLAKRLGVSESSIEEASQKGEDYFKDWSKRFDPALQSWQRRGNLFPHFSQTDSRSRFGDEKLDFLKNKRYRNSRQRKF